MRKIQLYRNIVLEWMYLGYFPLLDDGYFQNESCFCSVGLTGIHFISLGPWDWESSTLREIILSGECGEDKLASGSVQESLLCQAEEIGLAGSRGRPRQGRLGGPMLRPPPCLWQTRQWIISPSGTRPSAVGLRGKGAVIQHSAEELPLYVCNMKHQLTHTHTHVCIACTSTSQCLCTSPFPLKYTFSFLPLSSLSVSINRALQKSMAATKWSQISQINSVEHSNSSNIQKFM